MKEHDVTPGLVELFPSPKQERNMSERLFKDEVYTIVGAPRDLLFVSFVDPVISLEARPPRI